MAGYQVGARTGGSRGTQESSASACGSTRFRMLEAIRAHALDRLAESGEADAIRLPHARYFLALAREADSHRNDPRQVPLYAGLDAEHGNVRAALDWLLAYRRDSPALTELGLQIVVALALGTSRAGVGDAPWV